MEGEGVKFSRGVIPRCLPEGRKVEQGMGLPLNLMGVCKGRNYLAHLGGKLGTLRGEIRIN